MKVKVLSRSEYSTTRECAGDLRKRHRNLDPINHPLQRAREYTRAVMSAKIDRMFAKPFIGSLEHGHRDSITSTSTSPNALVPFISGSADGEIRIWDLSNQSLVSNIPGAHSKAITGLVFGNNGRTFYSCGDDGLIRSWVILGLGNDSDDLRKDWLTQHGPITTYSSPEIGSFKSIDYHKSKTQFATASDNSVDIWTPDLSSPIQSYQHTWGSDDTVTAIRYNPSERDLLACCSIDRGVGLFDIRSGTALKKIILHMRSNCIEWNPMEPMNFVVGNEDFNTYSFDMRKMKRPTMIYKGHVGAILCVNWSPTGQEFVTGSYDKTIRIFNHRKGKSRDIYHTSRMQHIFTINYSGDHKYIISGSDDSNIRLWKSRASEKIGQTTIREEWCLQYRQALTKKYENMPEVERIHKARKIPKLIKKKIALAQLQKECAHRKQTNRIKHDKTNREKHVSERKETVVNEVS